MPAKSRSQQRLFGMVHAYNKGEFRGSRSLRDRIERISGRISDEDATHFARTPHDGLPETKKEAQVVFRPEDVNRVYEYVSREAHVADAVSRSRRRRTLLGSVVKGGLAGAAIGGSGLGVLGAFLASKAMRGGAGAGTPDALKHIAASGLRTAAWGARGGAIGGAAAGAGLYTLGKMIEGDER